MNKTERAKVVVVIDDEEPVRQGLQRLLRSAGLNVSSFASAEEFLNCGQLEDAGCVIADIRMPGMSGLDLQSQLNAEGSPIPIIFLTAHGDENMRIRAMRAGAVAFLAKPFEREDLLDRVRTALEAEAKQE
jgi:FixJ family two-component response regulator